MCGGFIWVYLMTDLAFDFFIMLIATWCCLLLESIFDNWINKQTIIPQGNIFVAKIFMQTQQQTKHWKRNETESELFLFSYVFFFFAPTPHNIDWRYYVSESEQYEIARTRETVSWVMIIITSTFLFFFFSLLVFNVAGALIGKKTVEEFGMNKFNKALLTDEVD